MTKMLLPHQYYYPHLDLIKDRCSEAKNKEFQESLDSTTEPQNGMIYVHIPFCDSKCVFCGFDKEYNTKEMLSYVRKLEDEMKYYSSKNYINSLKIDAIHFGGGTPTLLPAEYLHLILAAIRKNFRVEDNCTINMEGSATTLYRSDIIDFIKKEKINRVSVGIQTFDKMLREKYRCKASLAEVYKTLEALKSNDIITYIDIMYGFPDFHIGNINKITQNDIKEAIRLDVDGIDFGQMFPYDNQLEKIVAKENLSYPNEKDVVDVIRTSTKMMEEAGYTQKTAYGFTKSGRIIIETSYYGGINKIPDCIALGSGSFGFINNYKYRNVSYNSYMNLELPRYSQIKKLTDVEKENIKIVGFPKLLMLSKSLLTPELINRYKAKLESLIKKGFIIESECKFELTEIGKCYIDDIYYSLLEEDEKQVIENQLKYSVLI